MVEIIRPMRLLDLGDYTKEINYFSLLSDGSRDILVAR